MRKKIEVTVKKPQFSVTTDVSFAQVDAWYGHTRMDLMRTFSLGAKASYSVWPSMKRTGSR